MNEITNKRKNQYAYHDSFKLRLLYRDLATVIRGDISIHIINNMLIVDITAYGMPWRYTTTDLKTDHTIDIITQYQDHIFNLFFDKEFDLML